MASNDFSQLLVSNAVDNAAPETLLTVPSAPATCLLRNSRIRFANTTGGAVTIKVWAIPSGGSAADANVCYPTTSIPANEFKDVDIPKLKAGGFVQAQAGAASSITALELDGFVQS